jgi:fumarylacetoacetase
MIFGFVLLNDWSARDIQQWEYVPLGPFQAKAFATSISPWVVTREALEPFRLHGPEQDPAPLPYLQQVQPNNYDLQLDVALRAAQMNEACASAAPISSTCTGRRCSNWCTTPHPAAP